MSSALISTPVRAAVLGLAAVLAACSSVSDMAAGDKIDYRSSSGKTSPLEVPPDLTQLSRDGRYQVQTGGVVSATTMQQKQQAAAATGGARTAPVDVAPTQVGAVRMERAGTQRWLVVQQPADQVWPRVKSFWADAGFVLVMENADTGVMETDWAENRAKIPQDFIRNTIGRVFDAMYSTGERDKFRTRIERVPDGTEIYLSHRGLEEVIMGGNNKDMTTWAHRPADPHLEAEMLTRMMVKLGARPQVAAVAAQQTAPVGTPGAAPEPPARARALTGQAGAAMQIDEPFDRAWRRVGLALDRGSFTVEDRDRAQGIYFVRYVDPKQAAKDDPGFMSRMLGAFGKSTDTNEGALARYRISIKAAGNQSNVEILNNQGQPDNSPNAQRIVTMLVDELK